MPKPTEVVKVRPVAFSPEVAEAVCEAVASTARGLSYLCAHNFGFPTERTVNRWLQQNPEFRADFDAVKSEIRKGLGLKP